MGKFVTAKKRNCLFDISKVTGGQIADFDCLLL